MAIPIHAPVPNYRTVLPSGMAITYRPFTVGEQKILLAAAGSDSRESKVEAIRDVLSRCCNTDVGKLPVFDLTYVLLHVRSKSVGESFSVGCKCQHCGNVNKVDVSIDKIKVERKDGGSNVVDLGGGVGFTLRYPGVSESAAIVAKGQGVAEVSELIATCIDTFFDEHASYPASSTSIEERIGFVDKLTVEQFASAQKFFDTFPSTVFEDEVPCSSCGQVTSVRIDDVEDFFG